MQISNFQLERFFAEHEFSTPHLLCCSDCQSMTIGELLQLEDGASDAFMNLGLGYTEAEGHPALRSEIARLYEHIGPDEILIHAGAEEAIFNFMNTLLSSGDHVIVQWPCYQSLHQVAESIGCDVSFWKTDPAGGWLPDPDELRTLLRPNTRAVIINSPHNPTGIMIPQNVLDELAALSNEHGFVIFSDEVYRFLEYDPMTRPPAMADQIETAVSLGVMSKSFGLAGLRLGWIATRNRALYESMAAFKDYVTICNSAPSEYLAEIALRHREKIISRNLNLIRDNLMHLDDFFARHAYLFDWVHPSAGPIAFPQIRENAADDFCRHVLDRSGILLLPGRVYGPVFSAHFRIGFGRRNMTECLDRLDDYMDSLS